MIFTVFSSESRSRVRRPSIPAPRPSPAKKVTNKKKHGTTNKLHPFHLPAFLQVCDLALYGVFLSCRVSGVLSLSIDVARLFFASCIGASLPCLVFAFFALIAHSRFCWQVLFHSRPSKRQQDLPSPELPRNPELQDHSVGFIRPKIIGSVNRLVLECKPKAQDSSLRNRKGPPTNQITPGLT